jgi:hypothetical protein
MSTHFKTIGVIVKLLGLYLVIRNIDFSFSCNSLEYSALSKIILGIAGAVFFPMNFVINLDSFNTEASRCFQDYSFYNVHLLYIWLAYVGWEIYSFIFKKVQNSELSNKN